MATWPRLVVPLVSLGLVIISLGALYFIETSTLGNIVALVLGTLGVAALGYSAVFLVHDPVSFSEKQVRVPRETRALWRWIRRGRRRD